MSNLTMKQFNNEKGQVVIVLLLLMLVVLSVGLAITQRSVTDVTTSSQTEQASRAFSAAEAGVEKAVQLDTSVPLTNLGNNSTTQVVSSGLVPSGTSQYYPVEYPPIGRETTAQFWLTDPNSTGLNYTQDTFNLYFGNPGTSDKPALEVNVVLKSTDSSGIDRYYTKKYFYDSDSSVERSGNNFTHLTCTSSTIPTVLSLNSTFYCMQPVGPVMDPNNPSASCNTATCSLVMVRVRLLYSNENHKIAIGPCTGPGCAGSKLPPQAQIYNSTGSSGQSQKQLLVFKVKDVVPPWFDFAIFSVNNIKK
jgi:hypothetical protein